MRPPCYESCRDCGSNFERVRCSSCGIEIAVETWQNDAQFYLWDPGTNPMAPEDYTDDDIHGW